MAARITAIQNESEEQKNMRLKNIQQRGPERIINGNEEQGNMCLKDIRQWEQKKNHVVRR